MRCIKLIAQWLFGLIVAATIGEGYLRLVAETPLWHFMPLVSPQALRPSPHADVDYLPGAKLLNFRENRAWTYIDSDGLPGASLPPRPADRPLIALLGNSMAAGEQVPEGRRFPFLLPAALARHGIEVSVASLAMPGATPPRMLARLQEKAPVLHPAYVLGVFSLENLFGGRTVWAGEAIRMAKREDGRYQLINDSQKRYEALMSSPLFRIKSWLKDHFRLYKMLADFADIHDMHATAAVAPPLSVEEGCTGMWRTLARLAGEDEASDAWGVARAIGVAFDDALRRLNISGRIAIYLHTRATPSCIRDLGGEPGLARVRTRIVDAIAGPRLDVAFLEDAIPGNTLRPHYGFGAERGAGHLNENGHAAWSRALANGLLSSSLLRDALADGPK
ncbi:SGNH/GDSL hydrolase family protein [Thalassospiraceae bacterium LMO-JJ14]|nr:SGNH/GDSL hydrolase family protein [Thalassospiraceae bacterium LMO-JJ14]